MQLGGDETRRKMFTPEQLGLAGIICDDGDCLTRRLRVSAGLGDRPIGDGPCRLFVVALSASMIPSTLFKYRSVMCIHTAHKPEAITTAEIRESTQDNFKGSLVIRLLANAEPATRAADTSQWIQDRLRSGSRIDVKCFMSFMPG